MDIKSIANIFSKILNPSENDSNISCLLLFIILIYSLLEILEYCSHRVARLSIRILSLTHIIDPSIFDAVFSLNSDNADNILNKSFCLFALPKAFFLKKQSAERSDVSQNSPFYGVIKIYFYFN